MSKLLDPIKHYSRLDVRKEIVDYSAGRWISLLLKLDGLISFVRYRGEKPLTINSEGDFLSIIGRYGKSGLRTIYASVNIYRRLTSKADLEDKNNIVRATPIWDIDGTLDQWKLTIELTKKLYYALTKEGVSESVYFIWSGRGVHVHINEHAFSEEIRKKYHPLDIAYSIVEYIMKKYRAEFDPIIKKAPPSDRPLKIENAIDLKRVFTVPLAIHKAVDKVAVCFKPEDLENYDISWADPQKFRHNPQWRKYIDGEGDTLAERAMREIGGYFSKIGKIRSAIALPIPKRITTKTSTTKIGRFQVMALLQAARYYILTGDLDKAKSFGLNRAIFYAWAKHYRSRIPKRKSFVRPIEELRDPHKPQKRIVYVGNEGAYVSPAGWFIMGDKEQRPEDFDKQVAQKIEHVVPFEVAWKKALEYVGSFPKEVLLDQRRFYEKVYKPVRDTFFEELIKNKKKDLTS